MVKITVTVFHHNHPLTKKFWLRQSKLPSNILSCQLPFESWSIPCLWSSSNTNYQNVSTKPMPSNLQLLRLQVPWFSMWGLN
jgi:hypothetical protein